MFLYKNLFFFNIYSFNPNHAYWNQRRLFSGNLPGMFIFFVHDISSFCETPLSFLKIHFARFFCAEANLCMNYTLTHNANFYSPIYSSVESSYPVFWLSRKNKPIICETGPEISIPLLVYRGFEFFIWLREC